jgi:hypothetical protein
VSWKGWLALSLGVVLLLTGAYLYVQRQQQDWVAKDVVRRAEIAEARSRAENALQRAAEAQKEVAYHKERAEALEGLLAASRAKRKNRRKAKTFDECRGQLKDCDEHVANLEQVVALDGLTITSLETALFETQDAAEGYRLAADTEKKRSKTFEKALRREKVKRVMIGIGAGAAGTLAGFGIGVVTQ